MVTAICRYPGRFPKSWKAFFPLTRGGETMDATVRPIGDINPAESVESEIEGFPRIYQWRIRFLMGNEWRLPESTQYESV